MLNGLKKFFDGLSWQIIFVVFLAILFLRSMLLPIIADDFSYAFIWDGDDRGNLLDGIDSSRLQPIESFSDILKSQWSHYFTWGGRSIAHIFVQLFVWENKYLFDVANTLVFAALVLLLFKVGTGLSLREMNKSYLLFILFGMYFCTPNPIITMVWLTGACNYLWMSTLIILFLLPYVTAYRKEKLVPSPKPLVPIMALLGLLAGWSIEPGAAVAVSVTSLFVLQFYLQKNLQPWMKVGFAFLLIGAAILFLAPGNFHRLELTNMYEPDELIPPDEQWTLQMFLINLVVGFMPDFLHEVILFLPIIIYFMRGKISASTAKFILTFAGAAMLCLMLMMFSPEFPERAGFPSIIFLMIASLAALKEILPLVKNFCRRIKFATLAATIFAAYWTINIAGCLYVEYDLHCQLQDRMAYVEKHKSDDLILVKPLKLPDWAEKFLGSRTWTQLAISLGGDFDETTDNNRSITFARYYGLKKIALEKEP
ncbi:MAG: hypothetical protein IJS69_02725 [Selenomonadaceae bacterium]|nr:hypothetical protein [Selenomonadaceae bacterium]